MRALTFSKRNLKEILRDPLSLFFCLAFPIFIFLIMELLISSLGITDFDSTVPQFKIENLTPSIAIFGITFLSLFSGLLVAKDRESSFQARLNSSPMKSYEFIIGYTLPLLIIALVQIVITFAIGFIFGLTFNFRILLGIISFIPIASFFIFLGLLLGSIFSEKTVGGVLSVVVNLAVLLSGMFFST